SDGKDVVVERHGARLKPLSGQFVLNFETRDLGEKVRVITERNADEWLALALEYEVDKKTRTEAMEAYDRALCVDPTKIEALLNCGTLYYENGNFEKASEYFSRAISQQSDSALAHFNLGSVLEEMGDLETARKHLRQAVRLDPSYPDARYNLAYVCEKLGAFAEAREHWIEYLKLDPIGPWSDYARQRLSSSMQAKSAGNL
ncbi:MAG TPA: tetratricopeptide repeat protein, partial [Candidatus Limnocylindrales bacterium]|nr:tetratricopeptide repeat protein [Candidatus Limnocylindrales bacterium]